MNSDYYSASASGSCENFDERRELSAEELEREFEEMDRIARMPPPEPDFYADITRMIEALDALDLGDGETVDNEVKTLPGNEVKTPLETAQFSAVSDGEADPDPGEASLVVENTSFLETPLPPSTTASKPLSATLPISSKHWEDYSKKERCIAFNEVVMRSGGVGFTLLFGHSLRDKALLAPLGFTDFVRRRIARRLNEYLGRSVDFWFAVDVSRDDLLHLHGGVIASPEEYARVIAALKLAGGTWEAAGGKKYQARLSRLRDYKWATYCAKKLYRAGKLVSVGRPEPLEVIAATKGMRTAAAAYSLGRGLTSPGLAS
jgi:hypothetical protein